MVSQTRPPSSGWCLTIIDYTLHRPTFCAQLYDQVLRIIKNAIKSDVKTGHTYVLVIIILSTPQIGSGGLPWHGFSIYLLLTPWHGFSIYLLLTQCRPKKIEHKCTKN